MARETIATRRHWPYCFRPRSFDVAILQPKLRSRLHFYKPLFSGKLALDYPAPIVERVASILAMLLMLGSADAREMLPASLDLAEAAAGPVSTAAWGARCIGAGFDDTSAFQAAIDTGHTVYAPALGGRCHITHALLLKTPGQIVHGDGRARTRLAIEPDFRGEGVFVAKTGEPGPVWRDLSVSFTQPDTNDRAKLTRYPPAFFARDTPRFEMEHLGCYAATICIDMKGNSGGTTIADLQMSAFEVGIDIDGSLDTVRIINPHWWPFQLSERQQAIFIDQGPHRAVGITIGRMDDFKLLGGLFLGGLGLEAHQGEGGAVFGIIEGTNFDTTSGIDLKSGNLKLTTCSFSLGLTFATAILQTGGKLNIAASDISTGARLKNGSIIFGGGDLSIQATNFNTFSFDNTSIEEIDKAGMMSLSGDNFYRQPDISFERPTINLDAGRVIAFGNFASDKGKGAGIFISLRNDNPFNVIIGNVSPGWPPLATDSHQGRYQFN